MLRRSIALAAWFGLTFFSSAGRATVDSGVTAELLATAHAGKLAIIGETSLQEECAYAECVVYVVDTTAPAFERRLLRQLPPRSEVLKRELCAEKSEAACSQAVSARLNEEEVAAQTTQEVGRSRLLRRYLGNLTIWQRARLGALAPPPAAQPLRETVDYVPDGPELVLDEVPAPTSAKRPLSLRLKERWTAASFRATTEADEYCSPQRLSSCHQEERWEDGVRGQAWICKEAPVDCAGRASLVRVEARWGKGPWAEGRSSWVEPGRLAQAAMSLIHDRTVNLDSLSFARHSVLVYALPHSTVIVGGFAHGMYANGSWFPVVVAVDNHVGGAPEK